MNKWRPAKKAQMLLLEPNTDCMGMKSIGTGIIPVCGSARSGKTTLALALMEWVSKNTKRDLVFMGMPDSYLEALPATMRIRSTNPPMKNLSKLRDSVVLLDDTALQLSSRDGNTSASKSVNRLAGVISHLGLTIIMTTQSMAGVDLSLLRYTEMAPLVKRVDPMALRVERSEWSGEISEAQYELKTVNFDRSLYYSIADQQLCKHPFSEWMGQDILSRPFRYMRQIDLDLLVHNPSAKDRKKFIEGEE
jgi:hypothetical protein